MSDADSTAATLPPVSGAEHLRALKLALPDFRRALAGYRIAVVCGGDTEEREVSLTSGNEILKALLEHEYDAELVDLDYAALDPATFAPYDALFLALHGGRGEDGTLQGYLECLGVPYVGASVAASVIGMQKPLFKRLATALGLGTPPFVHILQDEEIADGIGSLSGDRLVIKPAAQGSSVGVDIVKREQAAEIAGETLCQFGDIIIEEYIEGPEVTVSIFGRRLQPIVLPHIEIAPVEEDFYSYKAKYTKGETDYIIPARIDNALSQRLAEQAALLYRLVDFSPYVRIDTKVDAVGNIHFLEANTLPGFTPLSLVPQAAKASGISYAELLISLLYFTLGADS